MELQQITDCIVAVTDPVSISLAGARALKHFVVVVDATMTQPVASWATMKCPVGAKFLKF